jgi:hypothetical protein
MDCSYNYFIITGIRNIYNILISYKYLYAHQVIYNRIKIFKLLYKEIQTNITRKLIPLTPI